MNRTPVRSSNIKAVGYDQLRLVLEIEFHSAAIYQYSKVPEAVHSALMTAPSKGKYFAARIKDRFPCARVR